MAEKLVTIAKFTDYSEADLAKQLLDDFGIESVVVGQNLANIWPEAPVLPRSSCKPSKARHSKRWKSWNLRNLKRNRSNNTEGINWPITA